MAPVSTTDFLGRANPDPMRGRGPLYIETRSCYKYSHRCAVIVTYVTTQSWILKPVYQSELHGEPRVLETVTVERRAGATQRPTMIQRRRPRGMLDWIKVITNAVLLINKAA